MNEDLEKLLAACEPFFDACHRNDTDTLGRLSKDDQVLFVGSGSWTGSRAVTVGDLRKLHRAVLEIKHPLRAVPMSETNELLDKLTQESQDMGLYDPPFHNPMIKTADEASETRSKE